MKTPAYVLAFVALTGCGGSPSTNLQDTSTVHPDSGDPGDVLAAPEGSNPSQDSGPHSDSLGAVTTPESSPLAEAGDSQPGPDAGLNPETSGGDGATCAAVAPDRESTGTNNSCVVDGDCCGGGLCVYLDNTATSGFCVKQCERSSQCASTGCCGIAPTRNGSGFIVGAVCESSSYVTMCNP